MNSSLTLLQITDLHLLAGPDDRLLGVDTADSLRAVLRQALNQARPDAVLATGDITHHGEPEAYARFDELIAEVFDGPLLVLPGNHDESRPMQRYEQNSQLRLPGWTVLGLDSHQDGRPGARLKAAELNALKSACVEAADRGDRVVIALHHPLVDVGAPWLDKDRIQNPDELLEWLAEHSTTAAVVTGHAHQAFEARFRGISLLGTPATCFQFLPESGSFAIDTDEARGQPGYRWLWLAEDGTLTSEVARVEDFPLQIVMPERR